MCQLLIQFHLAQCWSLFIGHFGTNFPQELSEQGFLIFESVDGPEGVTEPIQLCKTVCG